ncbi:putative O-glycosylation ligase, exosortase A system-associated [Paremcibacter congregatus]|uniref:putative O-glycosylation ligase, exosortase A system-associated n=1 Tax=Paremcibacter congregatus TaxID=2043170 RepID=UPI003A94837B
MRDIFIFSAVLCIMLAALRKPQIGILGWLWLSIMNPHKEAFGWIYSLPVLDMIAGVTFLSVLINFKKAEKAMLHPIAIILLIFYFWACMSTIFATSFDLSFPRWIYFSKTMIFILLMLLFLNKKHWIIASIFVFVFAVGLTGAKGGMFTIITGGGYRIWGAPGTAWGDNNGVSLAMLMVAPMIFALKDVLDKKILRLGVYGTSFLSFICILGTQSRGGLVGIIGVSMAFFVRTKHKLVMGVLIFICGLGVLAFMPDSWKSRMETIQTYEQDESASTRIIQWNYAVQLANERPILGHGFYARFHQPLYQKYLTGIDKNRSVHSVIFQILEEQGYIGLFIYLLLMVTAIVSAHKVSKQAKQRDDLKWASSLLYFSQFSIVGFAFNGLTINVAYLDLYYYLLAFIVLLISHVKMELAADHTKTSQQTVLRT